MSFILEKINIIDIYILNFVYSLHNSFTNKFMIFITHLGDNGFIWIALTLFLIFHKKTKKIGTISVLSLIFCTLLVNVLLKPLVHRIRPFDLINYSLLIKRPEDFSFPSGHTAASFTMVYIFYKYFPKNFKYVFTLALLIALSRIYLTVHYPSDVIIGAIVGLLSGYIGDNLFHFINLKTSFFTNKNSSKDNFSNNT